MYWAAGFCATAHQLLKGMLIWSMEEGVWSKECLVWIVCGVWSIEYGDVITMIRATGEISNRTENLKKSLLRPFGREIWPHSRYNLVSLLSHRDSIGDSYQRNSSASDLLSWPIAAV